MGTGTALSGYMEGPILFRPTHRYDIGTENYDTREKMPCVFSRGQVNRLLCRLHTNIYIILMKRRSDIIPREEA